MFVNSDYFRVLGTDPALGRFFGAPEDGEVPSSDVVVLSHGFWQRRFASDPSILGKTLRVGPRSLTVIGVARESFSGVDPRRVDMWIPVNQAAVYHLADDRFPTHWGHIWLRVHVRLKRGVSATVAAARATTIYNVGFAEWAGALLRRVARWVATGWCFVPFFRRSSSATARRQALRDCCWRCPRSFW